MNENQKNFLGELAALLDKYSIDNVNTASVFYGIETNLEEYTPSGQ